jgi:hypothetical protein
MPLMPRPIITYAPTAHHGVTTLMSVGKDDAPGGQTIRIQLDRAAIMGGAGYLVSKQKGALVGAMASILLDVFGY